MIEADLHGADLRQANLLQANLLRANLRDADHYSVEQISKAAVLDGATMPDGVKLQDAATPSGQTFKEWAAMQTEAVDQQAVEEARIAVSVGGEEE